RRMDEIHLIAGVNDEACVNVQPDHEKPWSPLFHCVDKIADRYAPKPLDVGSEVKLKTIFSEACCARRTLCTRPPASRSTVDTKYPQAILPCCGTSVVP